MTRMIDLLGGGALGALAGGISVWAWMIRFLRRAYVEAPTPGGEQ